MPTYRLRLESLTCERPANTTGDSVELGVYEGTEGNPTRWLWRSGEELLNKDDRWDIEGLTPDFSGVVWISLMDEDGSGSDISYGRLSIDANHATTTTTPDGSTLDVRFQLHESCYLLAYRIVATPAAIVSTNGTSTIADRDLEPDLSMLAVGGDLPLKRRLDEIKASTANRQTFRENVNKLTQLCRLAVQRHERKRLGEYVRDSNDTAADKVALAGRMVRDAARVEFLIGWMFHQGYNANTTWETGANNANNRGIFPDAYLTEMGNTSTNVDDRRWCTSFSGSTYRWLGFHVRNPTGTPGSQDERGIFWSGYRLQQWARTGKKYDGSQIGDAVSTAHGGTIQTASSRSRWVASANSLPTHSVRWSTLWTRLQNATLTPQPGDIILIKNYTHTVTIDDVETSGDDFFVYTVEGNAGSAVRSRKVNLRSSSSNGVYQDKRRSCLASNTTNCERPPRGTPANQQRREYQRRFGIALVRPGWDNFLADTVTTPPANVASDDAENGATNVINVGNVNKLGELVAMLVDKLKAFMGDSSLPNGPWIENATSNRVFDWCGRPTGSMSIT